MKLDQGFNYAYLYGISDFWVTLFEDPDVNQRVLEAESVSLAEVYSRFLQLTSTMSLEDVSTGVGSDIQLMLIEEETVGVNDRRFKLPKIFSSCAILSDRPFLPQISLEQNVDYEIELAGGESYIVFSKPLLSYGFPFFISDAGLWRFALWATDAVVDEQLISKVYAPLVRVDPDFSSNSYKDYVKGLFFLYTHGPNLSLMERGMSLAIGIPLARTSETVLMTTSDVQTGQWLVVTDRNSYSLPYNVAPSVVVGQVLSLGDSLAKVVEIKDYQTDSEWWINAYIPASVLPPSPSRPGGGTAVAGSDIDYLMRTYLKTHTFLVKVNWTPGFNTNGFSNLRDIINRVKPSYTVGVFSWSVPLEDEEFETGDEEFQATPTVEGLEEIGAPGYLYRRDGDMQSRRRGWFIRCNVDPDSDVRIDDVDTVDPAFSIGVSDYLGTPGSAVSTTYGQLMPLYAAFEAEISTKLTSSSVTHSLPLPDVFALVGSFAGNADILSRDLGALPVSTEDYYSGVSTDRELNLFRAQMDGYEPEVHRSFYMDTGGLANPITLVFIRQSDIGDEYTVHALHQYGTSEVGPYQRPELQIPTTDELEIQMV